MNSLSKTTNFIIGLFTLALTLILVVLVVKPPRQSQSPSTKSNPSPPTQQQQSPALKILCWVLSVDSAENNVKSEAVAKTWGRRCDKLLVVKNGSRLYEQNQLLVLPIVHEGRHMLWHKVVGVCEWLYEHHLDQYDWFFKADDDTYLLVDELREFLSVRGAGNGSQQLVYYGHRFRPYVRQGYMSGGSGYVMSGGALARLVERGLRARRRECHLTSGQVEDVEMGACLESVGVQAGDTRDSLNRETFLPLSPMSFNGPNENYPKWYDEYAYYPRTRPRCCTNRPISLHYIGADLMYLIDWLLYDVAHNTN